MKIRTETINKKTAEYYLGANHSNRKLRSKIVNYYARQMSDGVWLEDNGDTIRISKSGSLLDGQHRLNALIKADVSLKFTIAYDIDDNAFEFIDIGTARHAGDILNISGVKNANAVAKIIKDYNNLQNGVSASHDTSRRLSNHEVLEIYSRNNEMYDDITKKSAIYYHLFNQIITQTRIAAYYLYLKNYNEDRVEEFFDKLCSGMNIKDKNDPLSVLRNKLTTVKMSAEKRISQQYFHVYIIKTWNAFIRDDSLRLLRHSPNLDKIPTPIG